MNTFHEAKWISAGDRLQNERAYYEEKPAAIFQQTFVIEKEIKKAIMSIVTDDKPLEAPKDPETCNVFALIKLSANKEKQEEIKAKYLA